MYEQTVATIDYIVIYTRLCRRLILNNWQRKLPGQCLCSEPQRFELKVWLKEEVRSSSSDVGLDLLWTAYRSIQCSSVPMNKCAPFVNKCNTTISSQKNFFDLTSLVPLLWYTCGYQPGIKYPHVMSWGTCQ